MFKEFVIPHAGLKIGHHRYDFEMGPEFLGSFEGSEFERGKVYGLLELEKKPRMLDMFFTVQGDVEVVCDRCGEVYGQAIEKRERLIVQYGDRFQERDEQVMVIPSWQHEINVAQYFYEFISLAVPLKRVHPEDGCDKETLDRLNEIVTDKEEENQKGVDPRWEKLKGLAGNNRDKK